MAETKVDNDTKPADSKATAGPSASGGSLPVSGVDMARIEGSQPSGLEPDGDRVAMVSRDVNGHPRQSENFVVLVPEGVSDLERDAHWNRAGEAQGAKHLSGGGREEAPVYGSWDNLTDKERAERAKVEDRELAAHNFREKAS